MCVVCLFSYVPFRLLLLLRPNTSPLIFIKGTWLLLLLLMLQAGGWLAWLTAVAQLLIFFFFSPLLACVPLWRLSFCLVLRFIFLPFFSYLLARRETHEDDQSFFLSSLCVRFERGRLEQQHMTMALVKRGSVCV